MIEPLSVRLHNAKESLRYQGFTILSLHAKPQSEEYQKVLIFPDRPVVALEEQIEAYVEYNYDIYQQRAIRFGNDIFWAYIKVGESR